MEFIECGYCHEEWEKSDMFYDEGSETKYVCPECHERLHPEEYIEEW